MKQISSERFDARARLHLNRLVYVRTAPLSARAPIEAQLVIWIPTAAANPASHVEGAARDAIAVGELLVFRVEQIFD
jgi:hypothetical protein